MIIKCSQNYPRLEDYDGYNDYYINPEFRPNKRKYNRVIEEEDESDNEDKLK